MLHSIYDLTTFCRKTTGDVPAKLVGASTTVVGSKMFLFGGRLVTERKMVSDLYMFDLESFVWEKIAVSPDDDLPRPRYFHSADTWNNKLIIFGGMSNQPDSINPDELCVLNDVRFFDITSRHWLPATQPPVPVPESLLPRARYAHLSSVTADRLFIIGGQDFNNTWLDDVCVYDLVANTWVQRRDYPRHCGTYRSVAVSSNIAVRLPQEEMRNSYSASTLGPPGQRFGPDSSTPATEFTPTESLIHLPYSAPPSEDHPSDIFLYSNYNFTDVKRELEVFSPLPDTDFTIQDKSSAMAGTTFPPGLRFPTGAILGTHLIIAGTYLAHSYQSFSIWVLDLLTMTWSRIDPGKAVESGSWFRGSLWAEANKFIIFGNRSGNLVEDYNRRLLSWDHVAVVDLEAFGIYQPPPLRLDITMQELGLAAFEENVVADFEIVCEDGRRIPCSRRVLDDRWPWFLEQRKKFAQNIKDALEKLPDSAMNIALPELPGNASSEDPRLDPRLTARAFDLAEPFPIVLALLQYFYTTALVTPLQHAPAVLSQLLVLATNYGLDHLESLVKHAMHRALSNSTSVGVYEVATLCSCRSLQIRALKTVMSYTQKRPSRSRGDKDHSKPPGGGGGKGGPTGGPSSGGTGHDAQYVARPRGTSDARWRNIGGGGGGDMGGGISGYSTRTMPGIGEVRAFVDLKDVPNARLDLDHTEQEKEKAVLDSASGMQYQHVVAEPQDLEASKNQVPEPKTEASEDDQITPLPVVRRTKSQRRKSVVSVHADSEINVLADFMSEFTDAGSSRVSQDRSDELSEHYSSSSIIISRSESMYAKSNRESGSAPSMAPSLSASVVTLSYSDSDHYQSSNDGHIPSSGTYHRPRPPRIFTDSMQSLSPSLTSSASYSSLSTGRYTSPITPLTVPTDLPPSSTSELAIIDERYANDDVYVADPEPDPFNMDIHTSSLFAYDRPLKQWPQQRSNVRWMETSAQTTQAHLHPHLYPQDLALEAPRPAPAPPAVMSPVESLGPSSSAASLLSRSPTTPRSAGGTSFGRLLRRKKSETQEGLGWPLKEKEKKKKDKDKDKDKEKKLKEKKVKTKEKEKEKVVGETPEQRRERIRLERLQDRLSVHPVIISGMVALG
ncbi:hypothetical protein D9615_002796 [Tricholomella constricta]|uniref:Regulatory protein ral2 n=1 Tax=Tricholomella constricta TaxID=117010 RepID=A0A8H5HG53_9AGAR|nr:hypothetical protein D9615_002796 [Tricholomella constricta]